MSDIFFSTHQTRNRKRILRKRGGILESDSLTPYRSPNSVVNAVAKRRNATDHILLNLAQKFASATLLMNSFALIHFD
jgi:hypothetical protein